MKKEMKKGTAYFLECCKQESVSTEMFCNSDAKPETKFEKAFVYGNINRIQPFHKYAIKYFPIDDLYICWNAQIKRRNNLRLSRKKTNEVLENNKLIAKKGIEYPWRKQEDVYVFETKDVYKFLGFLKSM